MPQVELPLSHRRDLLDLARVHRSDGPGDQHHGFSLAATSAGVLLRLDLSLRRPVRTDLAILIPANLCATWLESLLAAAMLFT